MSREEFGSLPVIKRMPIVKSETWRTLRDESDKGGSSYFWSLGANLVRKNPEHRELYEEVLRDGRPPETPDATNATVLLILRILGMQANKDGYQLPQIPSPINPLPALREFIPRGDGTEFGLIDVAYGELIRTNPVIGEIVEDMGTGAPDEPMRIVSIRQAKRGAVYAFYGVKAVIPRTE
jgi:hypothetical protein